MYATRISCKRLTTTTTTRDRGQEGRRRRRTESKWWCVYDRRHHPTAYSSLSHSFPAIITKLVLYVLYSVREKYLISGTVFSKMRDIFLCTPVKSLFGDVLRAENKIRAEETSCCCCCSALPLLANEKIYTSIYNISENFNKEITYGDCTGVVETVLQYV